MEDIFGQPMQEVKTLSKRCKSDKGQLLKQFFSNRVVAILHISYYTNLARINESAV